MARALEKVEGVDPSLCARALRPYGLRGSETTGLAKPKVPLSFTHAQDLGAPSPSQTISPPLEPADTQIIPVASGCRSPATQQTPPRFKVSSVGGFGRQPHLASNATNPAALQYRPWLLPSRIAHRPADFDIAD